MNYPYKRLMQGLLALSTSTLLIACGSGHDTIAADQPTTVSGTDVPTAATQDNTAAFNFVAMVVAMGEADTATPLVLGDMELAVSDTADVMPIAA
jgi:hypothetical protein